MTIWGTLGPHCSGEVLVGWFGWVKAIFRGLLRYSALWVSVVRSERVLGSAIGVCVWGTSGGQACSWLVWLAADVQQQIRVITESLYVNVYCSVVNTVGARAHTSQA